MAEEMGEAAPGRRVVIVGGGASGLDLATRLAGTEGISVTLADRAGSYVWKPRLHQVAAGTLDPGHESVSYLAQAARKGFAWRPGTLRGLDRAARTVTFGTLQDENGEDESRVEVPYDLLILAIGSHADDFGTPGVAEHCRTIDSRDEAESFYAALGREVIRTVDGGPGRTLDIAIVGAGATGVELAAELHQSLDLATGYGLPDLRKRLRITLVEAAPRILPALPERVSRASERVLRDLGVEVLTGDGVANVDEAGLTLKSGRRIDAALRVWAAGIRAPSVTRELGLETDKAGRIVVDECLRSVGDPAVLAMGDCAACTMPGEEKPVPATAQVAHQEARYLSDAVPELLAGKEPKPFRYKPKGALVSLGDYDAFGSLARLGILPGGFIAGRLAQLSYAALYRQYQWVVHGTRVPLVWAAGGLRRLAKPRVRLS